MIKPFRPGIDIDGRPDFADPSFGKTYAKNFLPYVHSTSRHACLIHKVAFVEIRWYEGYNQFMRHRDIPNVIANTVCGCSRFLTNGNKSAKMCKIPDPNAVLCGRCFGELPTFSKRRTVRIKKQWAKDHLGCKGTVEVIGPYGTPAMPPAMTPVIDFEMRRK